MTSTSKRPQSWATSPGTVDVDISSAAFWSKSFVERDEAFAQLRAEAPVSWHPAVELPSGAGRHPDEPGFWAVVRSKDVQYVSQNHDVFSSDQELHGSIKFGPAPQDILQKPAFIHMDPPKHTSYRRIVSAPFTPKGVRRLQEKIEHRAEDIVARAAGLDEFDFVGEVASKLPMLTVADIVGIPEDMVQDFADAGDRFVGASDPAVNKGADSVRFALDQIAILREIGLDVVARRRSEPQHDLATAMANGVLDAAPLADDDVQSLMLLLSVAGTDTTKQTTSHVAYQLKQNPDQLAWLVEDYDGRIGQAVEEFVRHASPVIAFARTATRDAHLGGAELRAGDKVAMLYSSANRDEAVFHDPHAFDLSRTLERHFGFGGGGVHYCLGHLVAKSQLKSLFRHLTVHLPSWEFERPVPLQSEFINGTRSMQVRRVG